MKKNSTLWHVYEEYSCKFVFHKFVFRKRPRKKCIWKRICQIHQIRWIKYKYKYKYMVWNLIKYKYKYKYALFVFVFVFANTNTYLTPALAPAFVKIACWRLFYRKYPWHIWIKKYTCKLLIKSQTSTVEVWEWISNFIPHFIIMNAITYPCWDWSYYTLRNEVRGGIFDSPCLSVCPSVNLSCLPCSIYSSEWIFSIFSTNDQ